MIPEEEHLLKSLADEMARRLSGSEGASAALLLERFGVLSAPGRATPASRPGMIGIWEVGPEGYKRSVARRGEWPFWADVPVIPPKGERRRVLLLGESVARGFLYDPELNPAKVLTATLGMALGQPVEVVDIAKSDLEAKELSGLIDAAPALAPDALVLFAGNNWPLRDRRDRHLEARALHEHGVRGLKELREQRLAEFVGGTLRRQLTELSAHLPVAVVVPEINLADWRLDAEVDIPWLPRGSIRRWLECRAQARIALAAGRLDLAASLAQEMVELDAGTAASGWTLLADCAVSRGDLVTARTCLEKARDAHIWDDTHQTPRVLSAAQEALRGCALPGRIAVVDLPRCFSAWQRGELPDRRLFMDYCHLSGEGIRVAMAATALDLSALLDAGRPLPELKDLVAASPVPSSRGEAAAHFAAAIHSAHWGQTNSAIAFHAEEAARQSPEIAQAMRAFLEIAVRKAPTWACAAVERLSAAGTPFLSGYVLRQPAKLFDPVLLPALAEALEKNGLPSVTFLAELRQEERSLSARPSDLLDLYHRASWANLDSLESPTCFHRAYAPTSRYPWVCRTPDTVEFELTCRRRNAAGPSECHLRINQTCIARLPLTPEWSTRRFYAPGEAMQAGVNWLEIDWPLDFLDGEEEIASLAREHELGRSAHLLPVFAEISSLKAVQR